MSPIGLGSFLLALFQLAVSGALMLYDLFTFFTIANALYYSAIMLVQFQKNFTTNWNVCTKQSERFQPTISFWWSFSHNYIKIIYFRTSPLI